MTPSTETTPSLFPTPTRVETYFQTLNPQQAAVATAPDGPALVIAGAGVGKTHTLVGRVIYLLHHGVSPEDLLLVTFTRKAAEEMITRVTQAMGRARLPIHGGTFHGIAHHLLRQYGPHLGLHPKFTVLDEDDALELINLLRGKLGLADKSLRFPKKDRIAALLSHAANTRQSLEEVVTSRHDDSLPQHLPMLAKLADLYSTTKRTHQQVDFDDLLVLLLDLLTTQDTIRQIIAGRYRYILVDEYQDTNRLQADLVAQLASVHGNVMAVGDDAQSIYRFRGADIQNILTFPQLFPGATVYRLEENYRITQAILSLANAVIGQAPSLYPKQLFTNLQPGSPPVLIQTPTPDAQAISVVNEIRRLAHRGLPLRSIAVLFRSSHLSFDVEIELSRYRIPFEKRGGLRLTDTAHVKDLLTYVKVLGTPNDPLAWRRLLMLQPKVGPKTAQVLADQLVSAEAPLSVLRHSAHSSAPLRLLANVLEEVRDRPTTISDQLKLAFDHYQLLLRQHFENAAKRQKDLESLFGIAERYSDLATFLTDLALDPPDTHGHHAEDHRDANQVVLSTIHSAKGLEWDAVFVIWTLDGKFPSYQSLFDAEALEEERRLLYVALTRAKSHLVLSYPTQVKDQALGRILTRPSRFLDNIPPDLLIHGVFDPDRQTTPLP